MNQQLKDIQAKIDALCDEFNALSEKLTVEEPSEEPNYDYPRIAYMISRSGENWNYFSGRVYDNTGWFPSSIC